MGPGGLLQQAPVQFLQWAAARLLRKGFAQFRVGNAFPRDVWMFEYQRGSHQHQPERDPLTLLRQYRRSRHLWDRIWKYPAYSELSENINDPNRKDGTLGYPCIRILSTPVAYPPESIFHLSQHWLPPAGPNGPKDWKSNAAPTHGTAEGLRFHSEHRSPQEEISEAKVNARSLYWKPLLQYISYFGPMAES